jgi:pentose-5-phosphate-3-epimerase
VDGGINAETAKQVRAAGANAVIAASFVFRAPEGIKKAMEILEKI